MLKMIKSLLSDDWERCTGNFKKWPRWVRFLLAVVVVLFYSIGQIQVGEPPQTLFAHFFNSLSREAQMSIEPMARTKLSEWAQYAAPSDKEKYLLRLEFEARFRSDSLNDTEETLRSLEPHGQVGGVFHRDFGTRSRMASWISEGSFDTRPKQFTVSTGGVQWSVPLDQIQWQEFRHTTSLIGGATVRLVLDDPNWIVLSDAKLMTTDDSPSQWLLQLQLRNHAAHAVLADEITLESQLKTLCYSSLEGYQSIVLDWRKTVEWKEWIGSDDLTVYAVTPVAGKKVNVKVDFLVASCNVHDVIMHVPTELRVTPEDSNMFYYLGIEEIEVSEEDRMQMANSPDALRYPSYSAKLPQLRPILESPEHDLLKYDIRVSVHRAFPRGLQVSLAGSGNSGTL